MTGPYCRKGGVFWCLLLLTGWLGSPSCGFGQGSRKAFEEGAAAWEEKNAGRAIERFSEAIRLDPLFADAYRSRGEVYGGEGDYAKAMKDMDRAIELNPEAITYFERGTVNLLKEDFAKAIADYNESERMGIDAATFHQNLAAAYAGNGDDEKAIEEHERAIKGNPQDPDGYNARGFYYLDKKDTGRAIADFDRAIKLDPQNMDGLTNRGAAYQFRAEYAKARADFELAVASNPQSAGAYNSLAWMLSVCRDDKFRDGKKAVEYAMKACELSGWRESSFIDTLAAAYAEAGDFDNAVKWERKYVEMVAQRGKYLAGGKKCLALYEKHQPFRTDR